MIALVMQNHHLLFRPCDRTQTLLQQVIIERATAQFLIERVKLIEPWETAHDTVKSADERFCDNINPCYLETLAAKHLVRVRRIITHPKRFSHPIPESDV